LRLRGEAEFAALAQPGTFRIASRSIVLSARSDPSSPAGRVRFGFTVGRRHARRAVDRVLVKRVLREAARHAAPALAAAAPAATDVLLRLRAPLPAAHSRAQLKRELRAEADALLARFLSHLARERPER
jgi:ribonuclease P protein component